MTIVQNIEDKIRLLSSLYEQQKNDNERLRQKIRLLEEELRDSTLRMDILTQQNAALEAARSEEEQLKSKLRKEVDHHLHEISKCLAGL